MKKLLKLGAVALAVGFAASAFAQAESETVPKIIHRVMNAADSLPDAPPTGGIGQVTPVIQWKGGAVMNTPNVYVIWYGNWNQSNGSDTPAGQTLVKDFLTGLGGSGIYETNTTYTGSGGSHVTGAIGTYAESNVGYLKKRLKKIVALNDGQIKTIVTNYINASQGGQPDPNGVYFVLTSSDVNETTGFCTQYCGWHTHGSINAIVVKYSFVGNANRCLSACSIQSTSPNSNAGVDGAISVVFHELSETVSDPVPGTGWTNAQGAENGDMCAWTFGQPGNVPQAGNGSYYNTTLPAQSNGGTKNYLLQRMLAGNDSKCYVNWLLGTQ